MATAFTTPGDAVRRERTFFFAMAIALAVTAVLGFGFFIVMGISSFREPWFVHVHGVTMMGWMGLYLIQNALVWRGDIAGHRRLGVIAGAWSVWMVPVGLAITATNIALHRMPPAFQDPAFFLAMDFSTILLFGGMAWTALALRARPDWHKRLMLGATINVVGPAWGRVVPLPVTGQYGVFLILVALLVYVAVAMAFDRRVHGRVHRAHYWTAGLIALSFAIVPVLAGFAPFRAFAAYLDGA